MNTKKALAGLLGLLGSFTAFSFFTGCLLPRSLAFLFTDNLQNPQTKVIFHTKKRYRCQSLAIQTRISKNHRKISRSDKSIAESREKKVRKGGKKTHLLSAFFAVSALDFDPFMASPVGKKLRSVKKIKRRKNGWLTDQIGMEWSERRCEDDCSP